MKKYRCTYPLMLNIVGGGKYQIEVGEILDFEFQTDKITALENEHGRICVKNDLFEKYFELAE